MALRFQKARVYCANSYSDPFAGRVGANAVVSSEFKSTIKKFLEMVTLCHETICPFQLRILVVPIFLHRSEVRVPVHLRDRRPPDVLCLNACPGG